MAVPAIGNTCAAKLQHTITLLFHSIIQLKMLYTPGHTQFLGRHIV